MSTVDPREDYITIIAEFWPFLSHRSCPDYFSIFISPPPTWKWSGNWIKINYRAIYFFFFSLRACCCHHPLFSGGDFFPAIFILFKLHLISSSISWATAVVLPPSGPLFFHVVFSINWRCFIELGVLYTEGNENKASPHVMKITNASLPSEPLPGRKAKFFGCDFNRNPGNHFIFCAKNMFCCSKWNSISMENKNSERLAHFGNLNLIKNKLTLSPLLSLILCVIY